MFKEINLILLILLITTNIFGVNDKIFSKGSLSPETLAQFLSSGNSDLSDELAKEFATIYIEESEDEGINWDVAFVQMCLETGFLNYGGLVDSSQNNFCGLGSFGDNKGAIFPTIREGVRAHIQHLKAYSSTEDLKKELLDPRFHYVQRGSAPHATDLAGRWAEDPHYGTKIVSLLKKINTIEDNLFVQNEKVMDDSMMGSDFVKKSVELVVSEESSDTTIKSLEETHKDEVLLDDLLLEESGWLR